MAAKGEEASMVAVSVVGYLGMREKKNGMTDLPRFVAGFFFSAEDG